MKKRIAGVLCCAVFALCVAGCGSTKYTCTECGKSVSTAYFDPLDAGVVMCEDCAIDYFGDEIYSNFVITPEYAAEYLN